MTRATACHLLLRLHCVDEEAGVIVHHLCTHCEEIHGVNDALDMNCDTKQCADAVLTVLTMLLIQNVILMQKYLKAPHKTNKSTEQKLLHRKR